MKASYNLPALATVFSDKNVLDCSQIILQFALFFEDQPLDNSNSRTPATSTADTSPINSSVNPSGDSFNFMIVNSKKPAQNEDLNIEVAKIIAAGLHEHLKIKHIDQK